MSWLPGKLRYWETTQAESHKFRPSMGINRYGWCGYKKVPSEHLGKEDSQEDVRTGVAYQERYGGLMW